MVTFAPDEIGLADTSPCAGLRADLKICLLNSDCCKKDKKSPRECLQNGLVPEECLQLRQSFFECKRSLVSVLKMMNQLKFAVAFMILFYKRGLPQSPQLLDNRRRFRGHKGY